MSDPAVSRAVCLSFYFEVFSFPDFSLPPKEDTSTYGTVLTQILVLKLRTYMGMGKSSNRWHSFQRHKVHRHQTSGCEPYDGHLPIDIMKKGTRAQQCEESAAGARSQSDTGCSRSRPKNVAKSDSWV